MINICCKEPYRVFMGVIENRRVKNNVRKCQICGREYIELSFIFYFDPPYFEGARNYDIEFFIPRR